MSRLPGLPETHAQRRLLEQLARPGAVFAELSLADDRAGDRAVAAAGTGLAAAPDARALALRFWRALLATPTQAPAPWPLLPSPLDRMGRLEPGQRTLVLLKLLSGLDDIALAALLGGSPAAVQGALSRAQAQAGESDWAAWPVALQARVDALPTARLVNIASGRGLQNDDAANHDEAPAVLPRWARRALAATFVATALALAATWIVPMTGLGDDDEPRIRTRTLGAAAEPASRFDAARALATHPDRAVLEIGDADAAVARDTAFFAWYQAERLGTSTYEPPPPSVEAPEGGEVAGEQDTRDAQ